MDDRDKQYGKKEDALSARVSTLNKKYDSIEKKNRINNTWIEQHSSLFQSRIVGSAFMDFPCALFPNLTIRTYLWMYLVQASRRHVQSTVLADYVLRR